MSAADCSGCGLPVATPADAGSWTPDGTVCWRGGRCEVPVTADADADYEHALGGLRGHIVYGEQTAGDTPIAWVQVKVALPYLRDAERALVAERTRADAAEADRDALRAEVGRLRAENTRLAHLASQTMDLVVERNHYRERAETHRARIDWMQSVAAAAMRDGLAACRDLRGRLRGEGLRLARAVAVVTAVRHEHATRAAWLATLPACASAPAGVVAAEAATRAALDGAPVDVVLVVDALRAENARLRAIVEGRTTAPTRDEVDVHFAAGGRWILRWSDGTFGTARGPCAVADASEPGILTAVRWWPLDRDGRPCAWPVTP